MPWILLAVVIVAFPMYLFMNSRTRIYEATSTVLVGQALEGANPDYLGLEVSQYLAGTYAYLAETAPLLENVIADLGLPYTSGQLTDAVTATVREGNPVLNIAVRDADPALAAAIANGIVAELVAASPTFSNENQVSVEQDLIAIREEITRSQAELDRVLGIASPSAAELAEADRLRERLLGLWTTYATFVGFSGTSGSNHLSVIQTAVPPTAWVEPRPLYFTAVAAAAALVIAVALAYLAAIRDDRVREASEVEEASGLPILAAIPAATRNRRRTPRIHPPGTPAASAIDGLRIGIEAFVPGSGGGVSIVLVSPSADQGSTETAANLAISLAGSSGNVLLVDADLLKPQQQSLFEVDNRIGLTTLLRRDDPSHVEDVILRTRVPGLRILPAGPVSTDVGWTGSGVFKRILPALRASSEVQVFDTPGLDTSTIGLALAAEANATVLVARLGVTTRSSLQEACSRLELVGANVLGVAVHGLRGLPPITAETFTRPRLPTIEPLGAPHRTPPHAG
jgi:capsular polysaccharide biosynthesis protein